MDNMVQNPRYLALNTALMSLRGEAYELHIKGTDELRVRQDSVMAEACNASFQVHLQVAPDDFVNLYNVAQLLAGPVLACATNSPVLFGKRLWAETRIALFEQSVDTRRPGPSHARSQRPRHVRQRLGDDRRSPSCTRRTSPGSGRCSRRTTTPTPSASSPTAGCRRSPALRLHTGTVWRWNRGCYGITDGVPHLRIENRVLPSGPTRRRRGRQRRAVARPDARRRTLAIRRSTGCCRSRSPARTSWPPPARAWPPSRRGSTARSTRRARSALDVLLPLAAEGLASAGVADDDRTRYLDVIERRVRSGHTGSRWLLGSLNAMRNQGTAGQRLNSVTAAMVARQRGRLAGRRVDPGRASTKAAQWRHNFVTIEQLMTTDLVTVAEDDPVELAANLMDWHRIRQVLVEDTAHKLVGLVSYRTILRLFAKGAGAGLGDVAVGEVMKREPVCVPPEMPPLRALELMRSFGIGALPVVVDEHLVGIVTEHDFMNVAGMLLLEQLDGVERTEG